MIIKILKNIVNKSKLNKNIKLNYKTTKYGMIKIKIKILI